MCINANLTFDTLIFHASKTLPLPLYSVSKSSFDKTSHSKEQQREKRKRKGMSEGEGKCEGGERKRGREILIHISGRMKSNKNSI